MADDNKNRPRIPERPPERPPAKLPPPPKPGTYGDPLKDSGRPIIPDRPKPPEK